jgi:hypothetical protein
VNSVKHADDCHIMDNDRYYLVQVFFYQSIMKKMIEEEKNVDAIYHFTSHKKTIRFSTCFMNSSKTTFAKFTSEFIVLKAIFNYHLSLISSRTFIVSSNHIVDFSGIKKKKEISGD